MASTVVVMEEQVAPEAVAAVEQKVLIAAVLEALVDYLMVKMEPQHQDLILEIIKVDMEELVPEAVVAVVAPMETVILAHGVEMVVPVSLSSHTILDK